MRKIRWLIYTVIIGLIPFIIRLIVWWLCENTHDWDYIINEVDVVAFGLVLHLSIINELENERRLDPKWKTICNGISIIMLIMFAVFLGISYLEDVTASKMIGINKLKALCTVLSVVSFLFCYAVYNELAAIEKKNNP